MSMCITAKHRCSHAELVHHCICIRQPSTCRSVAAANQIPLMDIQRIQTMLAPAPSACHRDFIKQSKCTHRAHVWSNFFTHMIVSRINMTVPPFLSNEIAFLQNMLAHAPGVFKVECACNSKYHISKIEFQRDQTCLFLRRARATVMWSNNQSSCAFAHLVEAVNTSRAN